MLIRASRQGEQPHVIRHVPRPTGGATRRDPTHGSLPHGCSTIKPSSGHARAAVHDGRSLTYVRSPGARRRGSPPARPRRPDRGHHWGARRPVHRGPGGFLGDPQSRAAYVPLDDGEPPRRVQAMAQQAGLNTVLILPGGTCRIRRIRHVDFDTTPAPAPAGFRRAVAATDCAYVMFTSGSTGEPDRWRSRTGASPAGVLQPGHPAPRPVARAARLRTLLGCSTIEIWSALLAGACLVPSTVRTLSPRRWRPGW